MVEKVPVTQDWIARSELVDWATRAMEPLATSIQLNAAELIQIGPGEPAQFIHRDSDSWPLPIGPVPLVVNAIVALDDCTLGNGASGGSVGGSAVALDASWPEAATGNVGSGI